MVSDKMSDSAITYEFSRCMKCFRPVKTCYCKYIEPFDSGVKFVFLMHPKEAFKQRTGTGRLAHLTLLNSEILIGIDFTDNKRLNDLLNDSAYIPLLLYPGEDAWSAQTESEGQALKEMLGNKTLLVIVVDSTWFFAKPTWNPYRVRWRNRRRSTVRATLCATCASSCPSPCRSWLGRKAAWPAFPRRPRHLYWLWC